MTTIILGRGEIGIEPTSDAVIFGKLPRAYPIGKLDKPIMSEVIVEIRFENLDGLNVLLDAIQCCKTNLAARENLSPELQLGA